MKKSLRTVFTAAMFAAANLFALPVSAEEPASDDQWKTIGTDDAEMNWSGWDDFDYLAGQDQYSVYGAQSFFGENRNNDNWNNYSWTVPALEDSDVTTTAADDDEQTTTTADDDEKTTTTNSWNFDFYTTATTTTVTMPQLLYGAPYVRRYIGDINMDGAIDSFDMIALRKLLVKGYGQSPASESYSDLNGDKKVNMADLILLQRYLLGKVNELIGGEGYLGFMENVDIEKIGSEEQNGNVTTTTTSFYDPREDIVVSLYGIKPAKDIIDQAIWQTKDNIDINISSEDE